MTGSYKYSFNFCQYATNPCGSKADEPGSYAWRNEKLKNNCVALTDGSYLPD